MFSAKQLALAALLGQVYADVEPIVMKGQHFFYENGTQFFVKGIAYQRDTSSSEAARKRDDTTTDYIDPLSDSVRCKRDVPILAAAGTNVIRTYALDPTADHDTCMELLADAGIYVISDLSDPDQAIDRSDPVWDTALYTRYTAVIDAMKGYKNVIGFFGGNEVTNNASNTDASAFVKAAVRDMKSYINSTAERWMGVGYAANDDSTIRDNMAHYFNCGDQTDAIDFWGYNIYEWCGESSYTESGYSEVVDFFSNYSVPVFFSEYGCNSDGADERIFEETTTLYGDEMSPVIAGGIVYMYFEETNDYGLVSEIDSTSVSIMKDYTSLSSRVNAASPTSTSMAAYTPTNSAAACPAVDSAWQAANILPPTPDATLCECMYESLSCVPSSGINGSAYSSIYGYICGEDESYCAGVLTNATSGVYGAYSMCNSTQMLGYILDQYYQGQNSDSSACSFNGDAVTQAASTASSCKSQLASASSANAYAATATAGTTATGTGSSSTSSSSSLAMPSVHKTFFGIGDLAIGLYMVMAMGAGAAMVAL
ncbi:glycoside hydrolase family 72 /Carbohydrate-binding module family 43 [Cryphonectria parasitica EP155]|uniref:1,3-beta-glucanosyltransferase n=1 Tax=Cryphonectria parasitica (strain ATCC 38755 / EP155) TaxID=660469 RepID=A0A9P4XT04_CRYP1|nr:glycoside hydrolase family 72 /Carbohydrate-binding module family 43 [Cryphonectria parasitica EP155]KAF3760378.1 glycoside hydrolase family 72 /Carbohydrate-binding module family 43 [Cryphonectria parasitica EP155]